MKKSKMKSFYEKILMNFYSFFYPNQFNVSTRSNFSRLMNIGWLLVFLPIVFNVLSYFSPDQENLSENLKFSRMVGHVCIIVMFVVWIKYIKFVKVHFYDTFIKLKKDKKLLLLLPLFFIYTTGWFLLYPLILSRKFTGSKKEQKLLKVQGVVGLLVFVTGLLLMLWASWNIRNVNNMFNQCKTDFIQNGYNPEEAHQFCTCLMTDNSGTCLKQYETIE